MCKREALVYTHHTHTHHTRIHHTPHTHTPHSTRTTRTHYITPLSLTFRGMSSVYSAQENLSSGLLVVTSAEQGNTGNNAHTHTVRTYTHCMHTCTHCTHIHTLYAHVHAHTVHTYTHTVHTYTHCTHIHTLYAHMHTLYAHTHTIHTYTHTYIHTYIHVYKLHLSCAAFALVARELNMYLFIYSTLIYCPRVLPV